MIIGEPLLDERHLTDLLVSELEEGLTPMMKEVGVEKTTPNETDYVTLKERGEWLFHRQEAFLQPENYLTYEANASKAIVHITKWPRKAPYLNYPSVRPFGLTFRWDLERYYELVWERVVRVIPSLDALGGLVVKLNQIYPAQMNISQVHTPFDIGNTLAPTFHKRDADLPPNFKENQLYFTAWIDYVVKGREPLEGQAKADAITASNFFIKSLSHFVRLYVDGQIKTHETERQSAKNFSMESLVSAVLLPEIRR